MNIKPILKFRFFSNIKATFMFFAIFVLFLVTFNILALVTSPDSLIINGIDLTGMIFIMVLGLNNINAENKMCLQNGVSRRTSFVSNVINGAIFSAILSLGITVVTFIYSNFGNMQADSSLTTMYGSNFALNNFLNVLIAFLFFTLAYFLIYSIAAFLSTVVARVPAWAKLLIIIGTPCLVFFVLPIIISLIPASSFTGVINFLGTITGFKDGNPFIGMVSLLVLSIVFFGLVYPISRRITYK